jgi:D-alanyl-D-alanine carboxypeptidase
VGNDELKVSETFDESYQISGADGGIVTTSEDLSRFARGLFKNELLAPDTLEQMVSGGQEGSEYGLGLEVSNNPSLGQDLGHTGGVTGWNAKMSYFPEQDATVVVTTNGESPDALSSLDATNTLAEKVSASAN